MKIEQYAVIASISPQQENDEKNYLKKKLNLITQICEHLEMILFNEY